MKAELWGLVVGLVAGAVFTFGVFVPFGYRMVANNQPTTESAPIIASCEERTSPLREQIAVVKTELAGIGDTYAQSQQTKSTLLGNAIPWPEAAGASSKKEAVELLVSSAVRESGDKLEVLSWSCDEFPCVVTLKGKRERYFDRFMEALTTRGFDGMERLVRRVELPRPQRGYVWTVGYWDASFGSEALRDRVSLRMDALMGPVMEPPRSEDD